MELRHKGTDKEGRLRLGNEFANKQWQVKFLDNGEILLTPMVPITESNIEDSIDKMIDTHKRTLDALK